MSGKKSELLHTEDWWAIWLGFALIVIGILLYLPLKTPDMEASLSSANQIIDREAERAPFRTIEWFEASDKKGKIKATSSEKGKWVKSFFKRPQGWESNPIDAFIGKAEKTPETRAKYSELNSIREEKLSHAVSAQKIAEEANFRDIVLNNTAIAKIMEWRSALREADVAKKAANPEDYNILPTLLILAIAIALLFSIGIGFIEGGALKFVPGFIFIFVIAVISFTIEEQSVISSAGLGYALWAIMIGLIISNTIGTPVWVMKAVKTEYFIKTGLVIMGMEILFDKILQIGLPGIFVAWLVTPVVIVVSFWIGNKYIKMPSKKLNIVISSAVSVCGVSAAIATAAACKAKKEELTLAVGLSLIFTALMMFSMPLFVNSMNMPEILGGAWMGGTIDATGAVAAAGAFLGEKALYVSATIKMIQNVMIGVISFFVAIYFTTYVEKKETGANTGLIEIWKRFPKFVLGFAAASIISSVISAQLGTDLSYALLDNGVIRGFTKDLRTWMFCLAFVSIGLSTNFRELKEHFTGGKPFILYIFGQTFNLVLTLFIAWLMFYVVFPEITAGI